MGVLRAMSSLMALQLTMMEQCIIRLRTDEEFPAAYTTEGPHFVAEGLTEAAGGSAQKLHNRDVRRLGCNSM